MEKKKTAIVIGAGIGGVTTAARLQRAGFQVTVLEKNDFTGGRCSLMRRNGYRFDTGPSLLLLPDFYHEAFQDLGTSIEEEGIELLRCDPNYTVYFDDGEHVVMTPDLAKMRGVIQKHEGPEGFNRYLQFIQESGTHNALSTRHVLKRNFESWSDMLQLEFTSCVIKLHVIESVYTRASKYFKSERLRRAFTFATMYLGMSPFDAPGTYSLLQYTELAEGVWYPPRIGKRMGVEYRLSTPVKSVALTPDQKRATGVILEDGSKLEADIVVVNADLVHSYNNLLPLTEEAKKLANKPMSCSAISFYWSLNTKVTKLDTHNVFLANEYQESFDAIFQRQDLPNEISFYANVPSRIDPAAAPEGCDAVVFLVPCGNLSGTEKNWPEIVQRVKAGVLKVVKARIGVDLGDKIVDEIVSTPHDWQQKFNLHQGAILGLAHDFFNVLCFRPKTKHPTIEACYFVGASTHPGTGVPVCLAGSKITSEQILRNYDMKTPWVTNEQWHMNLRAKEAAMTGGWSSYFVWLLAMFFFYAAWVKYAA
ncbi:hypothetical protein FPQ18DRAFT_369383 [Pyronema domesticum]|nr:hypothetical protein FPQ18DRAFT_369383 [Pyronema domesticum]